MISRTGTTAGEVGTTEAEWFDVAELLEIAELPDVAKLLKLAGLLELAELPKVVELLEVAGVVGVVVALPPPHAVSAMIVTVRAAHRTLLQNRTMTTFLQRANSPRSEY